MGRSANDLTVEHLSCDQWWLIAGWVIGFRFGPARWQFKFVLNTFAFENAELGPWQQFYTAPEDVITAVAPEMIITRATNQQVMARTTHQDVITGTTVNQVVPARTRVCRTHAFDNVMPTDAAYFAVVTEDNVVARAAIQNVVAGTTKDDVIAASPRVALSPSIPIDDTVTAKVLIEDRSLRHWRCSLQGITEPLIANNSGAGNTWVGQIDTILVEFRNTFPCGKENNFSAKAQLHIAAGTEDDIVVGRTIGTAIDEVTFRRISARSSKITAHWLTSLEGPIRNGTLCPDGICGRTRD